MKTNLNEISRFDKMINACHFDEAVSDEFKRFQKKRKKALYKRILVRLGKYSFYTGLAVSLFFGIKKISAVIGTKILVGSFLIAASASSVIIYTIVEKSDTPVVLNETDTIAEIIAPSPKKETKITHYTLGMQSFKTGSVDSETVEKVNRYMLQAMNSAKDDRYAANLSEIGEEKATYIVNQSIEKVNNSYYIQIKIIDKNTSAIMFASKGTAESENNLQETCNNIARQVISAVK
jgi:hypothetical protein